jgi:hypothetical protein
MESPNTRVTTEARKSRRKRRQKNLWKPVLTSKVVNPFTRALAPPFIGRRRDFLNPENTLGFREYSWCEHVHECLLHPVICGADFIHFNPATSSHSKTGLLKWRLWLGFSQVPENHYSKRFSNWGSPRFPNLVGFRFPEFHQIPVTLKRTADLRTEAYFGY